MPPPAPQTDPIAEARRQWTAHGWDQSTAMAAATSVMRAQQLVNASVNRALAPFNLTFSRWELLVLLSFTRTGSLPITKAGERLMIHPTGVSKLVDKLEAQGLVRRDRSPRDRRATLATILPAGRDLAHSATAAVVEARFGLTVSDEELERLVESLATLRKDAGDIGS